ncbi:efflux RND transporter periplasmic adaptor subunit [Sandaracinobacter neustonicus]|uniref:Efflux RND transporter periplasmic adaptor subunit n=2 Tax=Sandaracinobacter neustonicus TaxID=1715348 RepID=A0A501XVC7_9SPHN|nr:efflux RND transporter periplasmic adaptor subunit [Sandaracinobacter neustonicus]
MKAAGCAIAVALLLALGIGYMLFAGADANPPAALQAHPALTVAVARPRFETWPDTLSASGVIAPWEEASIGTQIGSYQLIEVRANVGDQVRRGQLLARLNPALLRAEEAQLIARYEQAKTNDRRAKALQAAGGISDQDALQSATDVKTASAMLAAKRLELRYTAILAPDDGAISARTATLGAVVPAGQELFRMIRRNRLEWRGELTAQQLPSVVPGQRIALILPDGSSASAVVRQIAPALNDQSRLAIVYADVEPGSRARAGMYVGGSIARGQSPALVVPADAVVIRDGHNHVVEIVGAGETPKVALRRVTPGRRRGDTVEIVHGLAGKERLVLRGGAFLNDGDVVRLSGAPR